MSDIMSCNVLHVGRTIQICVYWVGCILVSCPIFTLFGFLWYISQGYSLHRGGKESSLTFLLKIPDQAIFQNPNIEWSGPFDFIFKRVADYVWTGFENVDLIANTFLSLQRSPTIKALAHIQYWTYHTLIKHHHVQVHFKSTNISYQNKVLSIQCLGFGT